MKTTKELKEYWLKEESHAFSGWDFSYIKDRYREEAPTWSYKSKIQGFLKPDSILLDMGTGGGELLLRLRHPPLLTSVTEGWPPNYELCKQRLEPLGIHVAYTDGSEELPFEEDSFDIIINRHEGYRIEEVRRILKPNGFFITQQVGGSNNAALSKRLIPDYKAPMPDFNLENEAPKFRKAGFRIMYQNQSYRNAVFTDTGAVCYYAAQLPWEFPGFSVETCFDGLLSIEGEIAVRGEFRTCSHRFIIIAKNHIG